MYERTKKLKEKINRELRSGLYTLLILKTIENLEEAYGYEIIKHIEKKTEGAVKLKDATVYPILRYLDRHNVLESFWATSEAAIPRKYYTLTREGKELLNSLLVDYKRLGELSRKILEDEKSE